MQGAAGPSSVAEARLDQAMVQRIARSFLSGYSYFTCRVLGEATVDSAGGESEAAAGSDSAPIFFSSKYAEQVFVDPHDEHPLVRNHAGRLYRQMVSLWREHDDAARVINASPVSEGPVHTELAGAMRHAISAPSKFIEVVALLQAGSFNAAMEAAPESWWGDTAVGFLIGQARYVPSEVVAAGHGLPESGSEEEGDDEDDDDRHRGLTALGLAGVTVVEDGSVHSGPGSFDGVEWGEDSD